MWQTAGSARRFKSQLAGCDVQLSYFYDTPLPGQLAAPIQILHTARALAERDVHVTFFSGAIADGDVGAALAHYDLSPHPNLTVVPLFDGRPLRPALRDVLASASPNEPHVIMSRGEQGLALFDQLRALPRSPHERHIYEAHRPCYTQVQTWHQPRLPVLRQPQIAWRTFRIRQSERRAVEGVDGVVCLTEGVREALSHSFALTAPTLILPSGTAPPPDEVAPVVATAGRPARDLDILYAGKLARRKGVFDLVAALKFLPGRRLWLLGGDAAAQAQVREFASEQGVAERVELVGYVPTAEVRAWYGRVRVGVCPLPLGESDIAEQFTSPLKLLEMMACGTPIVATDLPTVRALVTHGETALLAPPSKPQALAHAICTLLEQPALAQQLADAARKAVAQYTWPQRARRLHEFLVDVTGKSK